MHFQFPTPRHGWRAFAGEVGVIVLGVLIALGFQQVASWINAAEDRQEARRAIRAELELDMARLRSRQQQATCASQRLDQLQELLDEAGAKAQFVTPGWVGRPQAWTMQRARWDASSQAGRAALLPQTELALYSSMYALMDALNVVTAKEATDWALLRSLQHLHSLSSQMHFELTNTLGDARYLNWRVNTWTRELEMYAERLNLEKTSNDIQGTSSICVPLETPTAEGLRLSQSPEFWSYGEP